MNKKQKKKLKKLEEQLRLYYSLSIILPLGCIDMSKVITELENKIGLLKDPNYKVKKPGNIFKDKGILLCIALIIGVLIIGLI